MVVHCDKNSKVCSLFKGSSFIHSFSKYIFSVYFLWSLPEACSIHWRQKQTQSLIFSWNLQLNGRTDNKQVNEQTAKPVCNSANIEFCKGNEQAAAMRMRWTYSPEVAGKVPQVGQLRAEERKSPAGKGRGEGLRVRGHSTG